MSNESGSTKTRTAADDSGASVVRAHARLSLERIVTETLALMDEQGIGMTSMRAVGERLGVRAMSLYRYVASREQLFDAVVERIVDELEADPEVTESAENGWRDYLTRLAWGVRRYALAHPHAFPLVATRPPDAPWINPPLRSLRWTERMLKALHEDEFSDAETVYAYRTFSSYLLGYLLLETSARVLRDPKPGDGSFQGGRSDDGTDPTDVGDPVPGGLSPTRSAEQREAVDEAVTPIERLDPTGEANARRHPLIYHLRAGLTEDHYEAEFGAGLENVLDRIAIGLDGSRQQG